MRTKLKTVVTAILSCVLAMGCLAGISMPVSATENLNTKYTTLDSSKWNLV